MFRFPEMNNMIQLMIGMAPVAAAAHMYSPIKYLAPVAGQVEVVGQEHIWFGNVFSSTESFEYDWSI